jgi:transmembrane sensor
MNSSVTDELILRSLQRSTTAHEEGLLARWRAAHPGHEARYRRLARLWELRGLLDPAAGAGPPPAAALLRTLAERPPAAGRMAVLRAVSLERSVPWLTAAAIAAVAAGGLVMVAPDGPPAARLEVVTVTAKGPEGSVLQLSDGSVVHVAADAHLEVIEDVSARHVRVEGRTYFAVTRDAHRPFIIDAQLARVRVLGTRFTLDARHDGFDLVVVDGAVHVAVDGASVELHGGDRVALGAGGHLQVRRIDDVYGSLDEIGSFVAFTNTPLVEVARELERRFGVRIEIADSALAHRTITSSSSGQSTADLVMAICLAVGATCTGTDDGIRMTVAGQPALHGDPDRE